MLKNTQQDDELPKTPRGATSGELLNYEVPRLDR